MLRIPFAWRFPRVDQIGVDQITTIAEATPAALLGAALNTLIVGLSFAGSVAAHELALWCAGSSLLLAYVRYRSTRRRGRSTNPVSSRTIKRAVFVALLLALPWAVLVSAYIGSLSHKHELLLVALCAGMAASGSVYLAPVYPAALTYMAVILLPTAAKCLLLDGYGMLGCLTISYACFLSAIIGSNARLSIERSRAIRDLADSNQLLQQREEELGTQNARFKNALDNMSQGLCFFDGGQRLIVCNRRYVEMYALAPEQVRAGMTLREIIELRFAIGSFPAMSAEQYHTWRNAISISRDPSDTVVELNNGRVFEIHHRPMPDGGWVATHDDITDRQALKAQLEQNNTLLKERSSILQAIIENFPGGIGFYDRDLRVVVCNERAKEILDLPDHFFAHGPPLLEDLLRFNAKRGEYGPGDIVEQVASKLALAKDRHTYRFERTRPDGTALDVRGAPIDNGGFITTYMDITERYRSESKIAHMASHDALTGLPNRVLFRERLDQVLAQGDVSFALLMLDLDRFKEVNDTLGHPVGDELLKAAGERLRTCIAEEDTLARLGGDEFAIIQQLTNADAEATALAARIQDEMTKSFDLRDHQVAIGVSVGIAIASRDGTDPDDLMKNADLALYAAKCEGRNGYRFFEIAMLERIQTRRQLERDLRNALVSNELEVHYQPLINLERDEVCGVEALLRWNHPQRGRISPADFIPLAEETGLIIPIGEWVLRQACADAATWPEHIKIAVNLSPAQFKCPALLPIIQRTIAHAGIGGHRLELEITESVMLDDAEGAFKILRQLRNLGVRIALDDFGTGYSSLSNLRKFTFDKIKIDRSFVRDLRSADVNAIALVRSMAQLGFSLGIATTAEGVETQEQLDRVRSEGYTEVQGYYLCRPAPAQQISALLSRQRSANAA